MRRLTQSDLSHIRMYGTRPRTFNRHFDAEDPPNPWDDDGLMCMECHCELTRKTMVDIEDSDGVYHYCQTCYDALEEE